MSLTCYSVFFILLCGSAWTFSFEVSSNHSLFSHILSGAKPISWVVHISYCVFSSRNVHFIPCIVSSYLLKFFILLFNFWNILIIISVKVCLTILFSDILWACFYYLFSSLFLVHSHLFACQGIFIEWWPLSMKNCRDNLRLQMIWSLSREDFMLLLAGVSDSGRFIPPCWNSADSELGLCGEWLLFLGWRQPPKSLECLPPSSWRLTVRPLCSPLNLSADTSSYTTKCWTSGRLRFFTWITEIGSQK